MIFSYLENIGNGVLDEDLLLLHFHKIIFFDISIPILAEEIKKNNVEYIIWIGLNSHVFSCFKGIQEKLVEYLGLTGKDAKACVSGCNTDFQDYFLEKAFIINNEIWILDTLINNNYIEIDICYLNLIMVNNCKPLKIKKSYLKNFTKKLERYKGYCKKLNYKIWDQFFEKWEFIIKHTYLYHEYIKKNGYIEFPKYLEKIGAGENYWTRQLNTTSIHPENTLDIQE